jgi:hypothetical protein
MALVEGRNKRRTNPSDLQNGMIYPNERIGKHFIGVIANPRVLNDIRRIERSNVELQPSVRWI